MGRGGILSRIHDLSTRTLYGKEKPTLKDNFYDILDKDMSGNVVSMSNFQGNVLLCVNFASKCGLTDKNYTQLVELVNEYGSRGFQVLAFPCNQFGGQEPGSHEDILKFSEKYDARTKFTWFEKAPVNGAQTREVYSFLKHRLPNTNGSHDIRWNFTMFLVDFEGIPNKRYGPTIAPMHAKADIEELLAKRDNETMTKPAEPTEELKDVNICG